MKRENAISEIHDTSINVEKREVFLHSYIGNVEEDPGIDYRSASVFIKNMMLLDAMSDKAINVHLFSIGGEWSSGMAMYDCIKACKSFVTIFVHGQASSMGSIVLQAADYRIMMPHSYIMCHFGEDGMHDHYLNAQSWGSFSKKLTNQMITIYADKMWASPFFNEKHANSDMSKAVSFLKRKLKDGDWFLSPEDAIYYGFTDAVYGDSNYSNWAKKC